MHTEYGIQYVAYTVWLAYRLGVSEDGLPRAVAVAWGVAEFPQRGPKRELSHEGIVDAAIELADGEGLDAVTMQRVAASFGFTTMALYRYITSKDELHRLMLDAALRDQDLQALPHEDWRSGLIAWAGALVACYRRHPWVLQLGVDGDMLVMPNNMAFVDAGLRAMRTLPLSLEERLGIIVTCTVLVRGFMAVQLELVDGGHTYSQTTRATIREVASATRFPDLAPLVASGVYLGEGDEPGGTADLGPDLEHGLTLFLDGVAARAEHGTADASAESPPSSPREAFQRAEVAWRESVAQRKAAEQRVKELQAAESERERAKDDAKELAKAAERYERRRARQDG